VKIFLIGLMGSGKSFWAKKLSALLHIPAFDLDKEIEKIAGRTVAAIFADEGESYFRQKENEVLKSFEGKPNFLLATGGGAPCFHDNMEWMNENGVTIWIDEPPSVIASRLKKEKSHRPLIAEVADDNLSEFFIRMRGSRAPYYMRAKYHLSGNHITEKDFMKIIRSNE
jgi:shikimate kinase